MGIFKKLVGAPDIGETIERTGNALDKLFTSKDEKLTHAEVFERIKQNPQQWQTEINKTEAGHRTIFVAGWRPFIGWVCGAALLYNYIVRDWLAWGMSLAHYAPEMMPPSLEMAELLPILGGMLGLGYLRTREKENGLTK